MPRGMRGLSLEQVRAMARHGAEATLKQLRAEIIAIERAFPELRLSEGRRAVKSASRRGRAMSAAAKKAVSARMKKYWAERRKAKKKMG